MINRDQLAISLMNDISQLNDVKLYSETLDLIKLYLDEYGNAKRSEGYSEGYSDGYDEGMQWGVESANPSSWE